MPATLFNLESFDWRSIAASHPATCVCGSCERARTEVAVANAIAIDTLAGDYRALLAEKAANLTGARV